MQAEQARLNLETRNGWDAFASHRAEVMRLLRWIPWPGRLAILGAGNCNDVILPDLLRFYHEVHLFDLDGEALAAGVERQGVEDAARLHVHGGTDIRADLGQGKFDVVLSACVLSQLVGSAIEGPLKENDTERVQMLAAEARRKHLRAIESALGPGGVGFLLTDVVSSDTRSALRPSADKATVASDLNAAVAAGNVFFACRPDAIERDLRVSFRRIERLEPWAWDIGFRTYAVCGFRFRTALI